MVEIPTGDKKLKLAEEAKMKEGEFQKALDEFQERIGYTFTNRDLLIQAMTSGSFVGTAGSEQTTCASNAKLEWEGDQFLRKKVHKWIERNGPLAKYESVFLNSILGSNVHLATRANSLGLQACVRHGILRARSQKTESKIRLLADVTEALIAAVYIDGGAGVGDAFVDRFILPRLAKDPLMKGFIRLTSKKQSEVAAALKEITKGKVKLEVVNSAKLATLRILLDGEEVLQMGPEPLYAVMSRIVIKCLTAYPWVLLGHEGDTSMLMPRASHIFYGPTVSDQSNYQGENKPVPQEWLQWQKGW